MSIKYVPGMNLNQTVKHLWGKSAKLASSGDLIHVHASEDEYKKNLASWLMALNFADGRDWGANFKDGVAEIVPVED